MILFSILNADLYFMTDRNETTSSTNPITNVVYEDIREDTNDERNKGKNYSIIVHLICIIYDKSLVCILLKSHKM